MSADPHRDDDQQVPAPGGKGGGFRKGQGKGPAVDLGPRPDPVAGQAWVPIPGAPAAADGAAAPRIEVEFCPDPQTLGGRFTTTYDAAPAVNFASLNAGDRDFFVGGATMNKQFATDLQKVKQTPQSYKDMHRRLFDAATPGELFAASTELLGEDPNLMAALVRKPLSGSRVGIVFIDVFKADKRPHECEKNVAMIYTVGPQRKDFKSDDEFLAELKLLAVNIAQSCAQYNQSGAEPRLEKVRVGLVSGGAFAGGVPKRKVATTICEGLEEGAVAGQTPIFEFAFDEDAFQQAWRAKHPA